MMKINAKLQSNLIIGVIALLMASLFFAPLLSTIFTVILGVFVLTFTKDRKVNFGKNKKQILLFSSIYWVYALGLLYTNDMDKGGFEMGQKLSFLAFPIIFGLLGKELINKKGFSFILNSFLAIASVYTLVCLINAGFQFFLSGQISVFFYGELSFLMHPSYYALYLNFALGIILVQLLKTDIELKKPQQVLYKLLVPLFILVIILLESKAGILGLIGVLLAIGLYIMIFQKNWQKALLFMGLSFAMVFGLFSIIPNSTSRITAVIDSVQDEGSAEEHSVSAARLYLWKANWQAIKKQPIFGYGTGDVKAQLIKEYQAQNNKRAVEHNYNSHNQYLQTTVATGLIGFLALLLIVLFPVYDGYRNKNVIFFLLGSLMFVNLLVESMFERQAGIMFYAFFLSFLYFQNPIEKPKD